MPLSEHLLTDEETRLKVVKTKAENSQPRSHERLFLEIKAEELKCCFSIFPNRLRFFTAFLCEPTQFNLFRFLTKY